MTKCYKCQAIYQASLIFCLMGPTYMQMSQMYRPHSAGCPGAVVVQTALAQASAADRRSFLQPYNHALHSGGSSALEHCLAYLVLVGFVAALAVRLLARSHWLRRMLRKHAGGTQALMLFEKCVDYFSDSGQSRSPRRTSKPG